MRRAHAPTGHWGMRDAADALAAAVRESRSAGKTLAIVGHGSKAFLGGAGGDALLATTGHAGIVDYRPQELVLTARAGTPLAEVAAAVAEHRQLLPFDPPRFGGDGDGTFGGAIACGFSGPARPWRGSVRDAVLGVEMINGLGERLRFGGRVIKNVAGFDVSRLLVGARGTLGVVLSASVRLTPAPAAEETYRLPCDAVRAGALCRRWARAPLPITATCFVADCLRVRLSGSPAAIAGAAAEMGLREVDDPGLWAQVRDHRHPFFTRHPNAPLTRLSLPRGCRFETGDALIEWGGCQAWRRGRAHTDLPNGAFATAFRGGPAAHAATARSSIYAVRLKQAFDPDGVFPPTIDDVHSNTPAHDSGRRRETG